MSNSNQSGPGLPPYMVPFGPHANCTLDVCPVQYSVYGYRPSLGINGTFLALYLVAGIIHAVLGIMWRQWWFMSCMIAGTINAVIGYTGRILMYDNPFDYTAFIMQIICITSSPVYYCAAIYVTLAQTVKYLSTDLSRYNPKLFYWVFLPCDVFSLCLQAAGGGLSTTTSGKSQTGIVLALVGLVFQVVTLVIFCFFFADYLFRYYRSDLWKERFNHDQATRLKIFLAFMAFAILNILARCSYRLAELHQGYTGDMIRNEGLFIWLEGVLIIGAVVHLTIGHPGRVFKTEEEGLLLPNSEHELPERGRQPGVKTGHVRTMRTMNLDD